MSKPPLPQSRRKLLKSIALGSGAIALGKTLPDSWTKPVIESVVLPVHAQASAGAEFTGTYSDTVILALQSGGPGVSDTVTAQVYVSLTVTAVMTLMRLFTGTETIIQQAKAPT